MGMNLVHRWYCGSHHWRRTVRERLLPWALAGVELGDDLLEIGPGPGLTTEALQPRVARMTAVELDPRLAEALARRSAGSNLTVARGDASALPLPDASMSAVVCFTMLHHLASPALQDRLLAEVARVLRPGGVFAGSDSLSSAWFHFLHLGDVRVPVEPESFPARLRAAGLGEVKVSRAPRAFRFRARKAAAVREARG